MTDPEKVERSRLHAEAALAAYREAHDPDHGHASPDDEEAIPDLICDLLHLAGSVGPADTAVNHYLVESGTGGLE